MINLKWINSSTNFLSTGEKFMPELHLEQSGFIYGACRPFSKQHETIQKLKELGNLKHLYRNELKLALLKMQHILIVKIYLRIRC